MPSTSRGPLLPSIRAEVQDINKGKRTVVIRADKTYFSAVQQKLKPYKAIPYKFKSALEEVSEYVRNVMIPRTFEKEGPGWAPLARRTMRERTFLGYPAAHPILKRQGDLLAELTEKSHPSHVEVIKTGKYARIEIGGRSKKFLENQMGNPGTNLPARPMVPGTGNIPIEDRDRRQIAIIIRKAVMQKRTS